MADNGHNEDITQPGRFGFASSSLRDALRAVAGLREPTTRTHDHQGDEATPVPAAPAPAQQPAPQPLQQAQPGPAHHDAPVAAPHAPVPAQPPVMARPQPAPTPVAEAQTVVLHPEPAHPDTTRMMTPQTEQTVLRRASEPAEAEIDAMLTAPIVEPPVASAPVEAAAPSTVPAPATLSTTTVAATRAISDNDAQHLPEPSPVAVDRSASSEIQIEKSEQTMSEPIQERAPAGPEGLVNGADNQTRMVRGVQHPDRDDYYQEPVVAWLVVIGGPGLGAFRPVYEGNNAIGRSQSQRIAIDFGDDAISAEEQAYIRYDSTDRSFLFVPNLAKTNVVSLNEAKPTAAVRLSPMDVITVGQTQLVFVPFCGPEFDWSELKDIQSAGAA